MNAGGPPLVVRLPLVLHAQDDPAYLRQLPQDERHATAPPQVLKRERGESESYKWEQTTRPKKRIESVCLWKRKLERKRKRPSADSTVHISA